jgi:60 kDa SS-A/Ro ribonucleoprotein
LTAMIRNLGKMSQVGLLTASSEGTKTIVDKLADGESLRKARVHPMQVMSALFAYRMGHGIRGSLSWRPVTRVIDALDGAFYEAFGNVEPIGGGVMLAFDVSSSMNTFQINGLPHITAREGSAAMGLITASVEDGYEAIGFTSTGGRSYSHAGIKPGMKQLPHGLHSIPLSPRQRLDDVISMMSGLPFGGTDCAIPMVYATEANLDINTFVVYTDNETWAGSIHPAKALEKYRQKIGHDAKLIVVGMCSNGFTIADPDDAGMLDVVGFDTAAPQVMSDFGRGQL